MGEMRQNILPLDIAPGSSRAARAALQGVEVVRAKSGDLLRDRSHGPYSEGAISGIVRSIKHYNPETGFMILRVTLDENGKGVTFVGTGEPVSNGDRVEAAGAWERHDRFGLQLRARFIRTMRPTTAQEIHAFLSRGSVKGIGPRSADKLLKKFGNRLADVLESPTTMIAAGITKKQAETISEFWKTRSTQTEVQAFLQSLNVGPATIEKIIRKYGDKTRATIAADPYRLARDISGLGFKSVDRMAIALEFAWADARRVDAGILHVMSEIGREGHCACSRHFIVRQVSMLLRISERDVVAGIERLVAKKALLEEELGGNTVVYESSVLNCEIEISQRIAGRISPIPIPEDIESLIGEICARENMPSLHENQVMAIKTSMGARFSVITGGPGSGKTSSLNGLLKVFEHVSHEAKVVLCAPTGRAAQKMSEATGRTAATIHRTLEWNPEKGGYQRNADNPIDGDILVCDEASMLDIWLMRDLLRAARDDTMIVLIGDVDQLPSVGAGRVLGDIIDSGVVPVTRLTKVFRQAEGSNTLLAAQMVNAGRMPRFDPPSRSSDLWGVWDENPEDTIPRLRRLVSEVAPDLGFDPFHDVQVITAGHQGILGTINLNRMIQDAVNPAGRNRAEALVGDWTFRLGDRVIQTSNDYDLEVFNGDIGQIVEISSSSRRKEVAKMVVRFEDREVEYKPSQARALSLAYAITVHKSQGSEFPVIVYTPTFQHYQMLKKTLVYTAMTRMRKICCFMGQKKAVLTALKKSDRDRVTGLARRLVIEDAEMKRILGT